MSDEISYVDIDSIEAWNPVGITYLPVDAVQVSIILLIRTEYDVFQAMLLVMSIKDLFY